VKLTHLGLFFDSELGQASMEDLIIVLLELFLLRTVVAVDGRQ
jgi:hypothetical protein